MRLIGKDNGNLVCEQPDGSHVHLSQEEYDALTRKSKPAAEETKDVKGPEKTKSVKPAAEETE